MSSVSFSEFLKKDQQGSTQDMGFFRNAAPPTHAVHGRGALDQSTHFFFPERRRSA
jgi:hypothetical protein